MSWKFYNASPLVMDTKAKLARVQTYEGKRRKEHFDGGSASRKYNVQIGSVTYISLLPNILSGFGSPGLVERRR